MVPKTRHSKTIPYALVIMLVAFSLSCGLTTSSGPQPNATLTAMSAAVAGTATAEASEGDETIAKLETAQANATATSRAIQVTQTVRATVANETQAAKATIAAPILAELPFYNVDTTKGRVGWMHPPLTLEVEGYQQFKFGNDFQNVTAADFVLAADLIWNTQYGTSGCGFMFRSDGNQNKPNQYMVIASRFANGRMIFTAVADGELANLRDFYPKDFDRSFKADNDSSNRIAIVARGNIIEIYTNQTKIGEVDTTQPPPPLKLPPAPTEPLNKKDKAAMDKYLSQVKEYEEIIKQMQSQYSLALTNFKNKPAVFTNGFLGMMALSESGRTQCTFENAWLWLIDQ